MAENPGAVAEERIDSAAALLDRIHSRNPLWNDVPVHWAFRGHGGARWSLVPGARRQDNPLFGRDGRDTGVRLAWDGVWLGEMNALAAFMETADIAALPLTLSRIIAIEISAMRPLSARDPIP